MTAANGLAAWSALPVGTLVVLRPGTPIPLVLVNALSYQVAPDGDLALRSRGGRSLLFAPGQWLAIGTVEHDDSGGTWVALERHAAELVA